MGQKMKIRVSENGLRPGLSQWFNSVRGAYKTQRKRIGQNASLISKSKGKISSMLLPGPVFFLLFLKTLTMPAELRERMYPFLGKIQREGRETYTQPMAGPRWDKKPPVTREL